MPVEIQVGGSAALQSLRSRAEHVRSLANRYERLKTDGNATEALAHRADALRKLAEATRPIAVAARLMATAGITVSDLPRERLAVVRDAVARAAAATATDPDAVLALVPADLKNALRAADDVRKTLATAWGHFANTPVPGEAILPVLSRFEAFREPAAQAARFRATLNEAAGRLPKTATDVEIVQKTRENLAAVFRELDGGGMDATRLDFLRRCVTGIPLPEILTNKNLLAWLEDNPQLTAALRVQVG